MSSSGPNAAKTSARSSSVSLSSVSSSWLRTNVAHWVSRGMGGRAASDPASGVASCRASARYSACIALKSNWSVSSLLVTPPGSPSVGSPSPK
ncbi:Uncharacterised protein [Mycobacteroides abscessus]|nr:Uncharacterised protein [Mycobacteroides abscessus]